MKQTAYKSGWIVACAVLGALVLALAGFAGVASAGKGRSIAPARPGIKPVKCWFEGADFHRDAQCYHFNTFENTGTKKLVRLPVIVLKPSAESRARQAGKHKSDGTEPVFFLPGGPGSPVVGGDVFDHSRWLELQRAAFPGRDLVLFDPRGVGIARPSLDCPELDDPVIRAGISYKHGKFPDTELAYLNATLACMKRLEKSGVDLASYNSARGAADAEALRIALGYKKIVLLGTSYGSLVAQHYLKVYGTALKAVVLDSVVPASGHPDVDFVVGARNAFKAMFAKCRSDKTCGRKFPDIENELFKAMMTLDATPFSLPVNVAIKLQNSGWTYIVKALESQSIFETRQTGKNPAGPFIALDGRTLLMILADMSYERKTIKSIPALIAAVRQGKYRQVSAYATSSIRFGQWSTYLFEGTFWAMHCVDEFRPGQKKRINGLGDIRNEYRKLVLTEHDIEEKICAYVTRNVKMLQPRTPVVSSVPVLLLSGGLDPVTGPQLARRVAAHLKRSYSITFANSSHATFHTDKCARKVVLEFLRNTGQKPAPACLRDKMPLTFNTIPAVPD